MVTASCVFGSFDNGYGITPFVYLFKQMVLNHCIIFSTMSAALIQSQHYVFLCFIYMPVSKHYFCIVVLVRRHHPLFHVISSTNIAVSLSIPLLSHRYCTVSTFSCFRKQLYHFTVHLETSLEWGASRICTRAYFIFDIHK